MDSGMIMVIIIALVAIFLAGIVLVSIQQNNKRREALKAFALERGFTYSDDDPSIVGSATTGSNFELFQNGHSKQYKNCLRGSRSGTDINIFDYRYTTGTGKNSHTYNQTALLLTLPGSGLPQFFLRPEGLFDKIATKLGQADIDFDTRPEFSKKYRLTGTDEAALRGLFNDALLGFFEENPNLCVEMFGSQALYYTRYKLIKFEDLPARLDNALKLAALLSRGSSTFL